MQSAPYNNYIMKKCADLQESTPSCKSDTLTIIWHFRKPLPDNERWTPAFRIPLQPHFR